MSEQPSAIGRVTWPRIINPSRELAVRPDATPALTAPQTQAPPWRIVLTGLEVLASGGVREALPLLERIQVLGASGAGDPQVNEAVRRMAAGIRSINDLLASIETAWADPTDPHQALASAQQAIAARLATSRWSAPDGEEVPR